MGTSPMLHYNIKESLVSALRKKLLCADCI
jgi:hypothetical protein